jgi:large subunit ribosomal protein L21
MYAVIETGGKQYKVAKGDSVYVEKLTLKLATKLTLKSYSGFRRW